MTDKIQFFLDTADVEYCKKIWGNFSNDMTGEELVGVTTNPSALSKINVQNFREMEKAIKSLCEFVTEARGDDEGVVYVQLPNSNMSIDEANRFIELVKTFSDGQTKVALKIPPFQKFLDQVCLWSDEVDINVTGVADCSTALKCFTYNVRYVSIIPGRMEERGLDANAHLGFVAKRSPTFSRVIAGSMRTIEGLRSAVVYDTVPTIGCRILDQVIDENLVETFKSFWAEEKIITKSEFSPAISNENTRLSEEFFEQMDGFGSALYAKLLE